MKKQLISLIALTVLALTPAWAEPEQQRTQDPPRQTVETADAEVPQEQLQRPEEQEAKETEETRQVERKRRSRHFLIPDFDLDSGF